MKTHSLQAENLAGQVRMAISTSDGIFYASYSARGLTGLDFPNLRERQLPAAVVETVPLGEISTWHLATTRAVLAILAGKKPGRLPPFDLEGHGEFRRAVWNVLMEIRAGETLSYGEVAERMAKPRAARAVGGACGANPIPLLIPCHRVVAGQGRIGGFSGGAGWKEKLLAREGVVLLL